MKKHKKNINIIFLLLNIITPILFLYILSVFGLPFRYMLFVLGAVIVHELGHYFIMKHYGYRNVKIIFVLPIFAAVYGVKECERVSERLLFFLAGPLPGIFIGTFALFLENKTGLEFFWDMGIAFLIINTINLFPIYPLDGGQFIAGIFKIKNKKLFIKILISTAISILAFTYFQGDFFILILIAFQVLLIIFYVLDNDFYNNYYINDITKAKAFIFILVYFLFLLPGVLLILTI